MIKRKRSLEKTRTHILKVAFKEVHTKGFQGISIDKIVKKTNLTKGAFGLIKGLGDTQTFRSIYASMKLYFSILQGSNKK